MYVKLFVGNLSWGVDDAMLARSVGVGPCGEHPTDGRDLLSRRGTMLNRGSDVTA